MVPCGCAWNEGIGAMLPALFGVQAGAIALVRQRCDHDLFFGVTSVALKGRPLQMLKA